MLGLAAMTVRITPPTHPTRLSVAQLRSGGSYSVPGRGMNGSPTGGKLVAPRGGLRWGEELLDQETATCCVAYVQR